MFASKVFLHESDQACKYFSSILNPALAKVCPCETFDQNLSSQTHVAGQWKDVSRGARGLQPRPPLPARAEVKILKEKRGDFALF